MIHAVKTLPDFFEDCTSGKKLFVFEIRKNDRPYCVGDFIALNEWDGEKYTGRCSLFAITYILDNYEYCKDGFVTMSITPCYIDNRREPTVYRR